MVIGQAYADMMIRGFKDEYKFLRSDFPCKIVIEGNDDDVIFNSVDHFIKEYRAAFPMGWTEVRDQVMYEITTAKFSNGLLGFWLQQTGGAILVNEDNDAYWGTGLDGKGKNMLGIILMRVREELKRI